MDRVNTSYISDILAQPAALRAFGHCRAEGVEQAAVLARGRSRIILTGMGASHAALIPAWRRLLEAGLSAWHLDTAELLSMAGLRTSPGTLIIAASQSGRSAELLALTEQMNGDQPLVAITNRPDSPLASRASATIDIHAGEEHAVSTKTYLNSLWAADDLARALTGQPPVADLAKTADALDAYFETWRIRVDGLKQAIGLPERAVIVGRENSVAAACYGGLILKEAAKWPVEALTSAQFRHGPLEMADERLSAFILGGVRPESRERNLRLFDDVQRFGAHAFWVDVEPAAPGPHLPIPKSDGIGRAAAEAVLFQLVSIAVAELSGIEPGAFRNLQKVTLVE